VITYRLNRGDITAIREVWMEESYRPPFDIAPRSLVDLGANIGLVILWYARHYPCEWVVAVEPLPANVRLLRENLRHNGIAADVIEAAVAARDGAASFAPAREFTEGRLGSGGLGVQTVSMESILDRLPVDRDVDLLKIDIEGSERELLRGDPAWLARVHSVIIEFHLDRVDAPPLIRTLERAGFRYVPSDTAFAGSMDGFTRAGAGR
jgi:FkbM family methyltransferase